MSKEVVRDSDDLVLRARTDDNLKFSCTTDYDITGYSLSFLVETKTKVIDLSSYCVQTAEKEFIVDVPASIISSIGNTARYKVGTIIDADNKDFLFGGTINITKGISL